MSTVYLGYDPQERRPVALKVLAEHLHDDRSSTHVDEPSVWRQNLEHPPVDKRSAPTGEWSRDDEEVRHAGDLLESFRPDDGLGDDAFWVTGSGLAEAVEIGPLIGMRFDCQDPHPE